MSSVGIKSETNWTIFLIARILKVTNHLIFRGALREGGNWTDFAGSTKTNFGEYQTHHHLALALVWLSRRQTLAKTITV